MSDLEHAKKELVSDGGAAKTSPKVDALIEAMFLAATADGEFAPEEALQFTATVEALSDRAWPRDVLAKRLEELKTLLRKEGRPARIAQVAARLPAGKGRETALILAAAITASDGVVVGEENDLLADLVDALGIEQDRAISLIQKVQTAPPR
jgi:tellurite resistance protein